MACFSPILRFFRPLGGVDCLKDEWPLASRSRLPLGWQTPLLWWLAFYLQPSFFSFRRDRLGIANWTSSNVELWVTDDVPLVIMIRGVQETSFSIGSYLFFTTFEDVKFLRGGMFNLINKEDDLLIFKGLLQSYLKHQNPFFVIGRQKVAISLASYFFSAARRAWSTNALHLCFDSSWQCLAWTIRGSWPVALFSASLATWFCSILEI